MDVQQFLDAALSLREQEVKVPELSEWFPKGKAVWRVRGLTAAELARANESADHGTENIKALVSALAGGAGDKADAIKKLVGIPSEDMPADISRRIEMLACGSVDPVVGGDNRDVAVRLAEMFPVTFYELTNAIKSLTGMGAELGKPKRSGKTQT